MSSQRSAYIREVVDLLQGAGLNARSGVAPTAVGGKIPTPYAVVYLADTMVLGDSIGCRPGDSVLSFIVISTDLTDQGAAAIDDQVADALSNELVAVDDRQSFPLRWVRSTGVQRDDDVTPPLFYVSSTFTVVSSTIPEEVSP